MDKLSRYRQIVKKILVEQASYTAGDTAIQDDVVFDENTDNYILSSIGWHSNGKRQQGYPIHIRIKDGKVRVEWDGTDQEIFQQLIDAGIPESDIVAGWDKPREVLKAA